LFTGFSYTGSITLFIYISFIAWGMWYVNSSVNESYRDQAKNCMGLMYTF
jgi:archaellum component FlaF (FlaF/FlaG flagellin family)